jgi:hypothetical protein
LFSSPADQHYPEIPSSEKLGNVSEELAGGITYDRPVSDDERIAQAIQQLKNHVPNLPEVLSKLAAMAAKKPVAFKGALLMINSMKI